MRKLSQALDRLRVDSEAMILGSDLDTSAAEIEYWMVRAMMAEIELVGLPAQRQAEDLMAKADAKNRLLADQAANGFVSIWQSSRVGRPIRQKDAVGVDIQD